MPTIINVEIDGLLVKRGWRLADDGDYHHHHRRDERIRVRDDDPEQHISWVHLDAAFHPIAHGRYGRDIREYIRDDLG
jgi:hypothetical protein